MQSALPLDGGHCNGPLFAPLAKRAAPMSSGTRLPGARRRARERRQTPTWVDAHEIATVFALAKARSVATGIAHSVEHIVPLAGGTVCGLHWHGNMEVQPLRDNLIKGTRWWPDMWEEQLEIFDVC